jgi:hypothetical protein
MEEEWRKQMYHSPKKISRKIWTSELARAHGASKSRAYIAIFFSGTSPGSTNNSDQQQNNHHSPGTKCRKSEPDMQKLQA